MTAKEIKNLRKKKKMTQVEFAEYLGIPYGTIQAWERAINKPSAGSQALLEKIKKGLRS